MADSSIKPPDMNYVFSLLFHCVYCISCINCKTSVVLRLHGASSSHILSTHMGCQQSSLDSRIAQPASDDAGQVAIVCDKLSGVRIPSKSIIEKGCNEDEVARACEDFANALHRDEASRFSQEDLKCLICVMQCLASARAQAMASIALGNLLNLSSRSNNLGECAAKAAELGALEAVVKALKTHAGDALVQAYASLALANLCRDSDERAAKAAELGALEAVVKALKTHAGDALVQAYASLALANLCRDSDERAAKAAELGALEAVVKALKTHAGDALVQAYASLALANLCRDSDERAAKAAELGALEAVVKALKTHAGDALVQAYASLALANLCRDSDERTAKAAELGALEAVVQALKTHAGDALVQAYASLALSNLCRDSDERAAKAAELGALEAVVKALKTHAGDALVQAYASLALASLCRDSDKRKAKAAELGALEAVVKALKTHAGDALVQAYASLALANLCRNSDERAAKAAELGALEAVVKALKTHAGDALVQAYASLALANLCRDSDKRAAKAAELGALEAVVKALKTHAGDALVQAYASLALANLCRDSDERAAKAAELGALEAVVKALKTHAGDALVQAYASLALANLCRDSDERRMRALDLKAFELIASALPKEEPVTQIQRLQRWRFWALGVLCFGEDEEAPSRRQRALELGVLVQMEKLRREDNNKANARAFNAVIDMLGLAPTVREASSKSFLETSQQMIRDLFQSQHGEAGHSSDASTDASIADTSFAYVSESTAAEAKKAPGAQEGRALPVEPAAEKQLKDAMKGRDPQQMKLAIQAAKAAKVRTEVLLEAHEALLYMLQDSQQGLEMGSRPLRPDGSDIPVGIHICQTLDAIYQCFQTPEVANGDEFLKACCQAEGCPRIGFVAMAIITIIIPHRSPKPSFS